MTFEEAFCARHPGSFGRILFWRCIPRARRPLVWIVRWLHRRWFADDEALLAAVAEAQTVEEVRREARAFIQLRPNCQWARRVLKLRISTTALVMAAKECLPDGRK